MGGGTGGKERVEETTTDGEVGKSALLDIKVRAGSESERDYERKGSPLYH